MDKSLSCYPPSHPLTPPHPPLPTPPAIPSTTIAMNWHASVVCCFQWNVTFSPVALCAGLNLWLSRSEKDDDMLKKGDDVDRR